MTRPLAIIAAIAVATAAIELLIPGAVTHPVETLDRIEVLPWGRAGR